METTKQQAENYLMKQQITAQYGASICTGANVKCVIGENNLHITAHGNNKPVDVVKVLKPFSPSWKPTRIKYNGLKNRLTATLKRIALTLIVMCAFWLPNQAEAQEAIGFELMQDARLALVGDKEHGYSAGTPNVVTRVKLQGKQQAAGYMVLWPEYEYAALQEPYHRYSVNLGYTFNQLETLNNKLETTIAAAYGTIVRQGSTMRSWGGNAGMGYKLNDSFKITLNAQLAQRNDLAWLYNDTGAWRVSGFIGLEYNIKLRR